MSVFGWFKNLFGGGDEEAGRVPATPAAPRSGEAPVGPEPTEAQRIEMLERELLAPLDAGARVDDLDPRLPLTGESAFSHRLDELAALDPSAAVRVLRRYDDLYPGHAGVLIRLGRLYDARRDHDAARNVLERLTDHPRLAGEVHERLGAIAERVGEPGVAVVHYQRGLVADWSRGHLLDACLRLERHLPEAPPPPPLVIVAHEPPEGYRIEHPLGRGGFGTVYLGRDEALDRPVAMKFLHPHLRRRQDKVAELFAEARLIASLDYRGVVGLYGLDRERCLMILEFMTHGTLADRLASGRPLTPRAALNTALQVARTLSVAHARDIVHRDLKPANVLFRGESEAVLGDFGIGGLETEGRRHVGTHLYAAPEVAHGVVPDRRADLYGVGLLLCEMLTARRPPLDPDDRPAWHAAAAAAMPHALRHPTSVLLSRLLADSPDQRMDDVDTLVATLEAFVASGLTAPAR